MAGSVRILIEAVYIDRIRPLSEDEVAGYLIVHSPSLRYFHNVMKLP